MSMHHREANAPTDLSSTMRYQRDNIFHWLHYFLKFFIIGLPELCLYLYRNKFPRILQRLLIGELAWITVAGTVFYFAPKVSLIIFIVPIVVTRFSLMAGNWAQHAFVDPERWDNDYATVTTFINSVYNKRCFNDGYHLAHHIKPGCHWSEMPLLFESHIDRMKEEQSLVFRKIDYFVIWFLLMTHSHRALAKFVVDLDPDAPMSLDDKVSMIRSRLVPITP
jgi:fatty acid desaturase